MTTAKFLQLTTAAVGTTWTPFTSGIGPISVLHVLNSTGTEIDFRRVGDTSAVFQLPTSLAWSFKGLTDAAQLQCRRADVSNTQVTLQAEAELEHEA